MTPTQKKKKQKQLIYIMVTFLTVVGVLFLGMLAGNRAAIIIMLGLAALAPVVWFVALIYWVLSGYNNVKAKAAYTYNRDFARRPGDQW